MIPTTPTPTTQARFIPNRAPAAELATRSPMSTNPPIAESTPRNTPRSRFIGSAVLLGERFEPGSVGLQRSSHGGGVGQVAATDGHPHRSDVVARRIQQRPELDTQGQRLVVRRLDRTERLGDLGDRI